MAESRIQTGDTEPIETNVLIDAAKNKLTGLTNVKLKIRRQFDNKYFDWSTNSFEISPVQLSKQNVVVPDL